MSNPFSRPEFGTLKSPYEKSLKLGVTAISEGKEDVALSSAKDFMSLSQ